MNTNSNSTYQDTLMSLAEELRQTGSKRTQITSNKKLMQAIELVAQFILNVAHNTKFKTRNRMVYGIAATQPLLQKHFENQGFSLHHNVVHNLVDFLFIRHHSYSNDPNLSYTKTVIGFEARFQYILENYTELKSYLPNTIEYKLQLMQQHSYELSVHQAAYTTTIGQIVKIKDIEFAVKNNAQASKIAILGRIDIKNLEEAWSYNQFLMQNLSKYQNSISKINKLSKLRNNQTWIENCLQDEGLYLDLYETKTCGRKYGIGITLQNINREIRKIILKGNWEIDQQSSHLNITQKIAQRSGIATPTLTEILNYSPTQIKTICKSLNMKTKTFKITNLALLNGYKGPKIKRFNKWQHLQTEIQQLKQQNLLNTSILFNAENHLTMSQLDAIGMQHVYSLEFDGATISALPNLQLQPGWKIKHA